MTANTDTGRYALLSVYDKKGILSLAHGLIDTGFRILSTGGTAAALRQEDIPVQEVSEYTGFPEILGGRVKTLHPKIHGGILGRPDRQADLQEMELQGIRPIQLLVVNLYPFAKVAADPQSTPERLVEMIDIGGPTMIRAAAKNHAHVGVVVDPDDYSRVLQEIRSSGTLTPGTRIDLARKAFEHTATYDTGIINQWSRLAPGTDPQAGDPSPLPERLFLAFDKTLDLRYGENPHQRAAFYRPVGKPPEGLAGAKKLHGKELSFNNLLDCDAAWRAVGEFDRPAAVIVKHTNPCGVALGENLFQAYDRARQTDPVSAFGGIVALNRPVDRQTADAIASTFLECVVAPDFPEEALAVLTKKKNIRLLAIEKKNGVDSNSFDLRPLSGSLLAQEFDSRSGIPADARVVTKRKPTDEEWKALDFAWRIVKHVKSNAIVFCRENGTEAIGAGQMSRVDSVRLARLKAGGSLEGTVVSSDAFFPFRDGVDALADAGATAVVQPGGSKRDPEVIAAADEKNLAMVFTGIRHFRH